MTAAQIDNAVAKVAEKINTDLKDVDVPIFLSILNGSFMFTADLMRKIEVKSDVVFVKLNTQNAVARGCHGNHTVADVDKLSATIISPQFGHTVF